MINGLFMPFWPLLVAFVFGSEGGCEFEVQVSSFDRVGGSELGFCRHV